MDLEELKRFEKMIFEYEDCWKELDKINRQYLMDYIIFYARMRRNGNDN